MAGFASPFRLPESLGDIDSAGLSALMQMAQLPPLRLVPSNSSVGSGAGGGAAAGAAGAATAAEADDAGEPVERPPSISRQNSEESLASFYSASDGSLRSGESPLAGAKGSPPRPGDGTGRLIGFPKE